MRRWLISVAVLAGCLHGPAPALDTVLAQRARFEVEWARHLSFGQYAEAARVAQENGLGFPWIERTWQMARRQAEASLIAYADGDGTDYPTLLRNVVEAHRQETIVACRHAPANTLQQQTISDVTQAYFRAWHDPLIFLLLDERCPLRPDERFAIVSNAAHHGGGWKDYALQHALVSEWDSLYMREFVKSFLYRGDCSFGFEAAARLKLPLGELESLLKESACEKESFSAQGWTFRPAESRYLFFAAVRAGKYHLAIQFNALAGGGTDGTFYIIQELFAQHGESTIEALVEKHPYVRDLMYDYAFAHGHARFVGMQARDACLETQAFDRLLTAEKFEDAAEVAEFSRSASLQKDGALRAFRAAASKDFLAARYLWKRYPKIVPDRIYEAARQAWNRAHPEDDRFLGPKKIPPEKRRPACVPPPPGDWGVTRCD